MWGTTRALIASAVLGVTKGYEKTMEVVGVGWQASVTGDKLKLIVGFANPIMLDIPKGVKVTVDKQFVKVAGPDKQAVGMFASNMRASRKPEPYNGKGVKYTTEVIKKKAGKAFGSA
jgi:large subunit ribosomal protein L6